MEYILTVSKTNDSENITLLFFENIKEYWNRTENKIISSISKNINLIFCWNHFSQKRTMNMNVFLIVGFKFVRKMSLISVNFNGKFQKNYTLVFLSGENINKVNSARKLTFTLKNWIIFWKNLSITRGLKLRTKFQNLSIYICFKFHVYPQ